MANGKEERHRHFILENVTRTEAYRSPARGEQPLVPARNRARHGRSLQRQIDALRSEAEAARNAQQVVEVEEGLGLRVEFESFPGIELAFESLGRERRGIELLNVRHEDTRTSATVFVPEGRLDHFENLVRDYLEERRDRAGRPRDNRRLIDAIQRIRIASLRALWTDDPEAFPTDDAESFWWEVWLPVRRNRTAAIAAFRRRAEAQEIEIAQGELFFPERSVLRFARPPKRCGVP